jgi:hypothetical protein
MIASKNYSFILFDLDGNIIEKPQVVSKAIEDLNPKDLELTVMMGG